MPFAVVGDVQNAQVLTSLSLEAEEAGLTRGQPLRDACAMCPELQTKRQNAALERAFLTVLRRWAGKFSPWVAEEPPEALVIDLTGCAHLFRRGRNRSWNRSWANAPKSLASACRAGIADTVGAAWALARYAGGPETASTAFGR